MNVGTKSLLFGVHQVLLHPVFVTLAWRRLYRRWPAWWEAIAIFFHDWGYWGKPDMDGVEGKQHPLGGAAIATRFVSLFTKNLWWQMAVSYMTLLHSGHYARQLGVEPSALCAADKCSVLFEPDWFYLLRAKASGELSEYVANAPNWIKHTANPGATWLRWYKNRVRTKHRKLL